MHLISRTHERKSTKIRHLVLATSLAVTLALCGIASTTVPEPFQSFDHSSENTIDFRILTKWLKMTVMDIASRPRQTARQVGRQWKN
jgi:hypothetical protein